MQIMRFLRPCLLLLTACIGEGVAEPTNVFRAYYIGNSVTDTIRYGELARLDTTRGVKLTWGRHMIPGAPLEWLYTHPQDGFREEPFGTWPKALGEFAWDAVSLQPFDRQLHGRNAQGEDLGDVALVVKLAALAATQNPGVQMYLYARWPRMSANGRGIPFDQHDYDPTQRGLGADLSKMDSFAARWSAPYTGGWDLSNESRDYFDKLLAEVRQETRFLKRPVLLVPVGHVMAALDERMKSGQVPGCTSIYQFYKDAIHLNEPGSYLVGCTYFATLLKQSPEGLPSAPYGTIPPALAAQIQRTVWEVVRTHPDAGIAPPR